MKFSLVMLSVTALLCACDTRSLDELPYAEQQKMLAKFEATCSELGINSKHPKYRECIQAEAIAENSKRSRQAAGLTSLGQGLDQAGKNYANASRAYRPTTCQSRRTGAYGAITTTCY